MSRTRLILACSFALLLLPGCQSLLTPKADAGPNQSVAPLSTVTLDGSKSTGASSYHWEQTGGQPVTLQNPDAAVTTFTAPAAFPAQALGFQLTVKSILGDAEDTDGVLIFQE